MSCPLERPLKLEFHGGERTILKRDAMLIRIETDKGLVGYAPGPASEIAQAAIEKTVAPLRRSSSSLMSGSGYRFLIVIAFRPR